MQMCPECDMVYDESEYSHCPYCSGELDEDEDEEE
jgi:RNA polymerase subunit RPABC4/transcription elongation factor Spt4